MFQPRRPGLIDLCALLIAVAAPVVLVIYGKADAATIVIVGEFIVGVMAVWFYQQQPQTPQPPTGPSLRDIPERPGPPSSDSAIENTDGPDTAHGGERPTP